MPQGKLRRLQQLRIVQSTPTENHDRLNNSLFPRVLQDIILTYLSDYVLRDWIKLERIVRYLYDIPEAINIIEKYVFTIPCRQLSQNHAAIHLLEKHPDKISWVELSGNPAAIHLLEKHPDKINWVWLSENPAAIHLLEANPDKINWQLLSRNPAAIHLLEANPDKISYISVV